MGYGSACYASFQLWAKAKTLLQKDLLRKIPKTLQDKNAKPYLTTYPLQPTTELNRGLLILKERAGNFSFRPLLVYMEYFIYSIFFFVRHHLFLIFSKNFHINEPLIIILQFYKSINIL